MTPIEMTIAHQELGTTQLSALQLTRAAIARWRGGAPATAMQRDAFRVSPQARHLNQAQQGLAEWIAEGGFSQDKEFSSPGKCIVGACKCISLHADDVCF